MEEFNKLSKDEEKKQFLGDHLYQYVLRKIMQIEQSKPNQQFTQDKLQHQASRVTGMIIEGQSIEFLLYLCNSRNAFNNIVVEA